ncbi:hypothetical protein RN01_24910 [Cupriavidus sp. SHE]|nr:hypothetical protein RN01_24910 [Cupriavidus sp. SHE]
MSQTRASDAAVLLVVAMLMSASYFLVTSTNAALLNAQLLGCGSAVVCTGGLWLAFRVRAIRRTRRLMKLVRSAWL